MIDQQTVDKILDTAQIVDVVQEFVTLRRRGQNYVGLCPFHSDKSPSFYVNPNKNVCKCFACGEGGSPLTFLMKKEQMTFHEAIKWLGNKYHIEVEDKKMTEEAIQLVKDTPGLEDRNSIVIYSDEWHKGVIGIVASRLTEIYFRPAVVLTISGDTVTGSARSVSGFDVYKAIQHCSDLLDNFGGHTYAAGLSLKVENVEAFKERFEEYVSGHIEPEQTSANLDIDAMITFRDITPKFHSDLKRLRPYGPENRKPLFCTRQVYDYGTSKVVGREQEHIKLELVDNSSNRVMNGIAFGQSSQARYIKTKRSFDIVYSIEDNSHKHGEVQLQIEDIKASGEAGEQH